MFTCLLLIIGLAGSTTWNLGAGELQSRYDQPIGQSVIEIESDQRCHETAQAMRAVDVEVRVLRETGGQSIKNSDGNVMRQGCPTSYGIGEWYAWLPAGEPPLHCAFRSYGEGNGVVLIAPDEEDSCPSETTELLQNGVLWCRQ